MITPWSIRAVAFLTFMAALAAGARAADEYLEYDGHAVAQRSDRFVYGEHHFLGYRDGRLAERVVLYTCRDGSAFARKIVDYVRPAAPDFVLEDASSGLREGVRQVQGRRVMFFRPRQGEEERSAALPDVDDLVIDAGFDQFVVDHWAMLTGQGRAPMHFLVPSRREFMNFEVSHVRRGTVAGIDSEVFRLKLAGVVGWVMSGIDVTYSRDGHRLLRYEGLSDLRDGAGDNIAADISFDPASRRSSTVAAGSVLREAPLHACPDVKAQTH